VSILILTLAACSGDEAAPPPPPPAPTSAAPTPTPTATPTPEPTPTSTPLTGGPALAVKIDHVEAAYPRIGLAAADVVYLDQVEYGLTRLLAVFSSTLPESVGPIRSARPNDPTILANWGSIPLVHSGASRKTYVHYLDAGTHIDVPHGSGAGFRRDTSRRAPHNLLGTPATLLKTGGGSQPPKDIGFRYGDPAPGGRSATSVSTRYPAVRMNGTYDPDSAGYTIETNGRTEIDALTGAPVHPTTIVIQRVVTRDSANTVSDSVATPLADLVGSGDATVLRDGKVWEGTWSRASDSAPTIFEADGQELTFAPGQIWVWFVPVDQTVTLD